MSQAWYKNYDEYALLDKLSEKIKIWDDEVSQIIMKDWERQKKAKELIDLAKSSKKQNENEFNAKLDIQVQLILNNLQDADHLVEQLIDIFSCLEVFQSAICNQTIDIIHIECFSILQKFQLRFFDHPKRKSDSLSCWVTSEYSIFYGHSCELSHKFFEPRRAAKFSVDVKHILKEIEEKFLTICSLFSSVFEVDVFKLANGYSSEYAKIKSVLILKNRLMISELVKQDKFSDDKKERIENKPIWKQVERKIYLGKKIARETRNGANYLSILNAFEDINWSKHTIEYTGNADLKSTVETLNDGCEFIQFGYSLADNTVSWSLKPESAEKRGVKRGNAKKSMKTRRKK